MRYAENQVLAVSWILHGEIRESGPLHVDRQPRRPSISGRRSYIRSSMLDIVDGTAQGRDMASRRPSPCLTAWPSHQSGRLSGGLFSGRFPLDMGFIARNQVRRWTNVRGSGFLAPVPPPCTRGIRHLCSARATEVCDPETAAASRAAGAGAFDGHPLTTSSAC